MTNEAYNSHFDPATALEKLHAKASNPYQHDSAESRAVRDDRHCR